MTLRGVLEVLKKHELQYRVTPFEGSDITLSGFSTLHNSKAETLTWSRSPDIPPNEAAVVICPYESEGDQIFIKTENPEYAFAAVLQTAERTTYQYIGPNFVQEAGSILTGRVLIGSNCKVGYNSVIGSPGLSRVEHEGKYIRWPHIGGIIIGDNVEILSNVCINRAVIDNTIIENDVMINDLVHIAHNSKVGRGTMIASGVQVCGSVEIGENCWIGTGAVIRQHTKIGNNVLVGAGAVVVKNVEDGVTVMGVPAKKR